jgi:hypothetical protein
MLHSVLPAFVDVALVLAGLGVGATLVAVARDFAGQWTRLHRELAQVDAPQMLRVREIETSFVIEGAQLSLARSTAGVALNARPVPVRRPRSGLRAAA